MKKDNTGLEDFVGRHRADFDTFEPRPDLWNSIELALDAVPAAAAGPVPLRPAAETRALPLTRTARGRYAYGLAATLALLLLAGLGVFWTQSRRTPGWARTGTATVLTPAASAPLLPDNPFGLGSEPVTTAAAQAPAQRATAAVLRMETYYAAQLKERQAELTRLDARAGAGPADWQREMTTLDSTYQQLKVELTRNPEPDVVLDAMNRNLQIRLDILNQQLRTRAQAQEYSETIPRP